WRFFGGRRLLAALTASVRRVATFGGRTSNSWGSRTQPPIFISHYKISLTHPCIIFNTQTFAFHYHSSTEVLVMCTFRAKRLLVPVGSCSTPISEEVIQPNEKSIMKIRAFVVTNRGTVPQLRG
ncbi:hypothetical protein VP01_7170g1, partial [Puccinia sorghi]